MEKVSFTYDPLVLTKLSLQVHLENTYRASEEEAEGLGHPKSLRYALFEYMRTVTDAEIEALLETYAAAEDVTEITLEKPQLERIAHHLLQTERFKALHFDNQVKGNDGLGVAEPATQRFVPCELAEHWDTLGVMLQSGHGDYGAAFTEIMRGNETEHAGITTEMLDSYVTENFVFVSASVFTQNRLKTKTNTQQKD